MAASIGLQPDGTILRALNPRHMEQGLPGYENFPMSRRQDPPGDGLSVGFGGLLSIYDMRSISMLRDRLGVDFAIAELPIVQSLLPVAAHAIALVPSPDPNWGAFAAAHGVITGYQTWRDRDGKKRLEEFRRHLVKLARSKFYPAGSSSPVSVANSASHSHSVE